jgi:hypothetical protein
VSPIFIRPVREQLEHDRLIRHLATTYKSKQFEVGTNVGDEQVAPVKIGTNTFFPDVVLTDGRKLAGLVEVETGESVNNLEAMAQWVHFSRARVPFHLYVPVHGYDAAKRLCEANHAKVSEIWTYRPVMDGFDLVRVFAETPTAAATAAAARRAAASAAPVAKPAAKPAVKPVAPAVGRNGSARQAKPVKPMKPAAARSAPPKGAKAGKVAKPPKSVVKPSARTVAKAASKTGKPKSATTRKSGANGKKKAGGGRSR